MSQNSKLALLFLSCLAYAILRYNVVFEVDWSRLPGYVINKTLAFTSVASLLLATLSFVRLHSPQAKFWGKVSFHSAVLHTCLSLALNSPHNYPAFFRESGDFLNLKGQLIFLSGALGIWVYWILFQTHPKADRFRQLKVLSCLIMAAHLIPMGIPKWVHPSTWKGMPQISLLSFALVMGSLVVLLKRGGTKTEG